MMQETDAKKRKTGLIIGIAAAAVLLIILAVWLLLKPGKESGGDLEDGGYTEDGEYADVGSVNYYAGIVEAQKVLEVNRDADKEVAEVLVSVGDEVTEGQDLFTYDTAEMLLKLEQARIELDSIGNDITDYQNQINQLNKDLKNADQALKLEYQMQISEISTSIKQAQLSQKTKQAEITAMEKSIENATVHSTISGVVKSIAQSSSEQGPYMTILATGTYQIKGTVDEMNVGSLSEGMGVIIHSRLDDTTWKGTISKSDTEDKAENSQEGMYTDNSSMDGSTKYYFYVTPENVEGLLLGQHVFLEPEMPDFSEEDFSGEMPEMGDETGSDEPYVMEGQNPEPSEGEVAE